MRVITGIEWRPQMIAEPNDYDWKGGVSFLPGSELPSEATLETVPQNGFTLIEIRHSDRVWYHCLVRTDDISEGYPKLVYQEIAP